MENAEIRETLRELEQVWRRVGAAPESPEPRRGQSPGAQEMLAALIRENLYAAQRYRLLSRRTRGSASAHLLAMAAERARDARALQEQYYLLTGDSLPMRRETPEVPGTLRTLRLAWAEEAAYQAALAVLVPFAAEPEDEQALREAAARAGGRRSALRALLRETMR